MVVCGWRICKNAPPTVDSIPMSVLEGSLKKIVVLVLLVAGVAAYFWADKAGYFIDDKLEQPTITNDKDLNANKRQPIEHKATIILPQDEGEYVVDGKLYAAGSRVEVAEGESHVFAMDGNQYWHGSLLADAKSDRTFEPQWIKEARPGESGAFQVDGWRRGAVEAKLAAEPQISWQVDLKSRVQSNPIIVGDKIYIATRENQVVALDAKSGSELWHGTAVASDVTSAVVGDYVFAANDRGTLDAYRVKDGKRKGEVGLDSFATSITAVEDGLLTMTAAGSIQLLRTERNLFGKVPLKEIWSANHESLSTSPSQPVVVGERAFIQTPFDDVVSVSLKDGAQVWLKGKGSSTSSSDADVTFNFVSEDENATSTPASDGNKLYAALGSNLQCFDLNGEAIWSKSLKGKAVTSVSMAFGLVILGLDKGELAAYRALDGVSVWRTPISNRPLAASPLILGNRILVATREGEIRFIHPLTGATASKLKGFEGQSITATPAYSKLGLVVVSESGRVISYK